MADFWNTSIRGFGNLSGDYGMDGSISYAENKKARIHLAHENSGRVVSFKAFIDGLKIDGDYGVETEQNGASDFVAVTQGLSSFFYSLNLNVPAYSYNEARANLARFQQLSRYIISARGVTGNETANYVYVLLANMIQNGLYDDAFEGGREISDWSYVRKYGAKVFISTLDFTPDLDMGFFEMGGNLIAKAYKVSLKMQIQPSFQDVNILPNQAGVETTELRSCFDGFVTNSRSERRYSEQDTKHWPFGITMDSYEMNRINLEKFGKDGSGDYAMNKGAIIRIADEKVNAFVNFKAFLDDFKFKREVQKEEFKDTERTVEYAIMGGSLKPDSFTMSIKVPAHSVNEARANLQKIQYLFRMAIKKSPGTGSSANVFGRTSGGQVYVHFANMIKRSTGVVAIENSSNSQEWRAIKYNGLLCILNSLSVSFEDDAGMFEMNGYLYPKVLNLSFDLQVNDEREADYGRQSLSPEDQSSLPSGDNSGWLFGVEYDEVNDAPTSRGDIDDGEAF